MAFQRLLCQILVVSLGANVLLDRRKSRSCWLSAGCLQGSKVAELHGTQARRRRCCCAVASAEAYLFFSPFYSPSLRGHQAKPGILGVLFVRRFLARSSRNTRTSNEGSSLGSRRLPGAVARPVARGAGCVYLRPGCEVLLLRLSDFQERGRRARAGNKRPRVLSIVSGRLRSSQAGPLSSDFAGSRIARGEPDGLARGVHMTVKKGGGSTSRRCRIRPHPTGSPGGGRCAGLCSGTR